MQADESPVWTRAQRRLHWWTAGLVLAAFPVGWQMVSVPLSQLLEKFLLYQLHKTIGITVLVLAVARLLIRMRRGRPSWDTDLPLWQRQAAAVMHLVLYALLVGTPALGYLTAATAPARVPTLFLGIIPVPHLVSPSEFWFAILRQAHWWMAASLMLLAAGHAAAAIHNHRHGRATLVRMWRGHSCERP
ncbi:cytochrome b [Limobrevibacterium gyesilva]|uniref:Cytochrome b/b6 domain-containing protein n=1 Tax=Limobrevibacterium gyesilva TaxID=2991712 RepID=A0AA41YML2_9PROT|nr:cytochrome b/b6 domain-containing protein [Limobrevibacterium gyesilva]